MEEPNEFNIDNVTTHRLRFALSMCDISIPIDVIDKIIDLVELVGRNGGSTSIDDVMNLKEIWRKTNKLKKSIDGNTNR